MTPEQEKEIREEEYKIRVEHRDILLSIASLLETDSGKAFVKYLYKHFEVAQMPPIGLEGVELSDLLGVMRAGNSIFKLVSEADFKISADILSEIERERYEFLLQQSQA